MAWTEVELRLNRLIGVHDDRLAVIRSHAIPDYYDACARERLQDEYFQGIIIRREPNPLADSVVRTTYIPLYRYHSKRYFFRGEEFPRNWEPSERKRLPVDRYSPFGTQGHYFSLTLEGAENEALYYGRGVVDKNEMIIVVLDLYLDGILDLLSSKLSELWKLAGLERDIPIDEMYLRLMNPRTDNAVTNAIGLWARRELAVSGLIYPSARYGQLDWVARGVSKGLKPVPLINRVAVGSQIDRSFFMSSIRLAQTVFNAHEMRTRKEFPVSAEASLVLFDGNPLYGRDRAVFYQTCPVDDRTEVEAEDDKARQQNFLIRFGSDAWFQRC